MGKPLSIERLYELLIYDPETGLFHWAVSRRKCRAGAVAGHINAQGYWAIGIDGTTHLGHRLAWLYMTGRWPACQVDHENRNRSDNSWLNLREATQPQNNANTVGKIPGRPKGIHRHSDGRWRAQIRANGAKYHLGCFDTQEEAGAAYAAAAKQHFGEFARAA